MTARRPGCCAWRRISRSTTCAGARGRWAARSRSTRALIPRRAIPSWRFAVRDAVRGVLAELTPRQRAALILREAYGLTGDQLAQALGVSTPAAKMLLFRAREAFRVRYERQEAGL